MQENQKKEDLRNFRRTKKLLSNALFELIKKKPFDKVWIVLIFVTRQWFTAQPFIHISATNTNF